MTDVPRLAIGSIEPATDGRFAVWGLLQLAARHGLQAQHFHSRCCFFGVNGALPTTGLGSRHLDSWTMSSAMAQELFSRAMRTCDLAVVEGEYDACALDSAPTGGSLDTLCDWLGLTRVVVVDAEAL